MSNNHKTGKIGELAAVEYLQNKGYSILERNWRFHRAEIDIIAECDELLVFIEVKSKKSDRHGKPEHTVTRAQQKLILLAASGYMSRHNYEWAVQFDVIGVLIDHHDNVLRLTHHEDAFFPQFQ